MLLLKNEKNLVKLITVLYFGIATIEVIFELFFYKPVLLTFKALMPLLLMFLYWTTSIRKSPLFFITVFFLLLANLFFISDIETMFFYGTVAFLIHLFLIIFYVVKLTRMKDYVPSFIAITPFLFIFFYLFSVSSEIPKNSYYFLMIQNVLVSGIGAITLSDYTMNDTKKNPWLLIFGLLSVALYFIVFIEKYYIYDAALFIFKPLATVLNTAVYYTFYKFVIATERVNIKIEDLYDN